MNYFWSICTFVNLTNSFICQYLFQSSRFFCFNGAGVPDTLFCQLNKDLFPKFDWLIAELPCHPNLSLLTAKLLCCPDWWSLLWLFIKLFLVSKFTGFYYFSFRKSNNIYNSLSDQPFVMEILVTFIWNCISITLTFKIFGS